MVNYKYAELYKKDSVDKQVKIEYDGGVITNKELFSESMELTESLCSESELRFGSCEASVLKFKVANIMQPLIGKWLTVAETLDGNMDIPFQFGRYKVYSDKPTADRKHREIQAYDAMYDILNTDVADWYNTVLPNEDSTMKMKDFRTSFIQHFGLEQEEAQLINDDMVVEKTIEPSEISGKDVITAICEINGCFGHISRNGKFRYIYLDQEIQGLYPANDLYPADDLYPREPKSSGIGKGLYISCDYEDFLTKTISKLQIRQEENDIGAIAGTGSNCYIIEDNFLVYGKGADDLKNITENIYGKISGIIYRPFECDAKGNPCLEVGDAVRLSTRYELIETYILKRTLKGIQALRDAYSADGVEEYSENVNSLNRSILQLKGKTNILTRTVEETQSTIKDVEAGLESQITQTASKIRSEVKNTTDGLQSQITQTASEIKSEVSRATEAEGKLSSRIIQTESSITAEVSRAKEAEGKLSSSIKLNANEIQLRVQKDSVISSINQTAESIKIKASKLQLDGDTQITGGTIHIETEESVENIIQLSRPGTLVQMGNDGVRATSDTREGVFQYSQIGVTNHSSSGDLIARLNDDGTGISSLGWNSYSDRRLKHDIKPLDVDEAAAFIYRLTPSEYVYNYDSTGTPRHGLIAQEVKEAMGDKAWALHRDDISLGDKAYQGLEYQELIADLIATVQSLNKRVLELEGR